MSQSNFIAAALALAFLLFITARGELPAYLALFKAKPHAPAPTVTGWGMPSVGGSAGGSGGGFGDFAKILPDLSTALPTLEQAAPLFLA